MKKIDLHIHTISTFSDSAFTFSIDTFKKYVKEASIDAVAITNHDVFDLTQFLYIKSELPIVVFPGIEINVDKGHLLLISNDDNLEIFDNKTKKVSEKITKIGDTLSYEELIAIFGNLDDYLLIPHYDKDPVISGNTFEKLKRHISAGEVDSPKKFIRSIKDDTKLTPVLFSDSRMKDNLINIPTRQTFVDCGSLTIDALKVCFRDKTKITLSENDGNKLWQIFDNGQKISTGLNVLLGARSSGKTYTLDQIDKNIECVKYIKQFSLVQQSDEDEFKKNIEKKKGTFADDYLSGLKRVIDAIFNIDLVTNELLVEKYIGSLKKAAEDIHRQDAFSRTKLFDEVEFPIGNTTTLTSLIHSVRQVIENIEYRDIITKHVDLESLKNLIIELIETLREKHLDIEKRKIVNGLIKDIKNGLKFRSSSTQIEDVDLYKTMMDKKRVERFEKIIEFLKRETVIYQESIQSFQIEVRKKPFTGAGEIKNLSRIKTAFSNAYNYYDKPYQYLKELIKNEDINRSEIYKYFIKIEYKILNSDGFEVSGGERSEFRLLQEISDSQNYDLLLIDEPESSFDNVFLKSDVNQIIKDISRTMPVILVTHNSTVGGSVGADYILYTKKDLENGKINYRIYSGYPTDKILYSLDGKEIKTYDIILKSLEAGIIAYEERRMNYEATKD